MPGVPIPPPKPTRPNSLPDFQHTPPPPREPGVVVLYTYVSETSGRTVTVEMTLEKYEAEYRGAPIVPLSEDELLYKSSHKPVQVNTSDNARLNNGRPKYRITLTENPGKHSPKYAVEKSILFGLFWIELYCTYDKSYGLDNCRKWLERHRTNRTSKVLKYVT